MNESGSFSSNVQNISGAAHAWNIAFNDLKRRYKQSQTENQNLSAQLKQQKDHISYLYKQYNHLNQQAVCKNESLSRMEEVFIVMRKQERSHDLHFKDLTSRIEDLNAEITLYQKERTKAMEENQNCRTTIEQLLKDKKQLQKEMENLSSIPEIAISPTSSMQPLKKNELVSKEMEDLLSENKHLKTSIHWISDELNKLKSEKQIDIVRAHRTMNTGCLEEGLGKLTLANLNQTKNISSYIDHLHNTIKILKGQLFRSLHYLKRIDPNNLLKEKLEAVKNENGRGSFVGITKSHSSPNFIPNDSSAEPVPYQSGQLQLQHNGSHMENNSGNPLYPSLLQNLQMQQTRTYLNSNTQQQQQQQQTHLSSKSSKPDPSSRIIRMYDDYSSD